MTQRITIQRITMSPSSFRHVIVAAVAAASLLLSGCQFQRQADAKFGDQHFKTAVALIELYRVRHGSYPETLADLDFTGDWDPIAITAVTYRRLDDGYELDLARGWVGKPTLAYPEAFWHGLGLRQSNVGHLAPPTT